ncbi:MAG: hypothetical protein JO159_15475 [Acidobacteria bacterium]|nr:hypothetical protein [Acidobacteriota bacterium]MBV9623155.1 hypothetical protein [Acidobacteriota bacterium]
MPRKHATAASRKPKFFFVKELSGENPPSFATMETLCGLAAQLYAMQPWNLISETELVLVRDPITQETCYCSMMGVLGQVVAMYAYIGAESLRLFRKMESQEISGPGEFFGGQHSVYVEFVAKRELEPEDRRLFAAVGHRQTAKGSPIFRAIRPGFRPWFVTEEEGQTLAEAIRAMITTCSIVSKFGGEVPYWQQADTFPLLTRVERKGDKPEFRVELTKCGLPPEPPLPAVQLRDEQLHELRHSDYIVRGVMEIDYFISTALIGRRHERKALGCVALAADADTGIVFPPEIGSPAASAGDLLVCAIIKAVRSAHALPQEIRVQNPRLKECLGPVSELCGFPIKVVRSLPAVTDARAHLERRLGGDDS